MLVKYSMANPLDLIVDTAQIASVSNPQRTTVNPAAAQIALAVQNTQGQTATLPTTTPTEPVIVTQITRAQTAESLLGGTANQIPVQTALDTTGYITAPQVADRYLYWDGTSIRWNAVSVVTSYNDLTNKPNFAAVATSGSYNDLLDKPTIVVDYNNLLNKPTLFSGSYTDLSNKPTIPAAQVNSDWTASTGVAQILNKPTLATVATSGLYTDLGSLPTLATGNVKTVAVSGQTSVALALDGTLTLAAATGSGFIITTNNTTKTVTLGRRTAKTGDTISTGTYTMDCSLYEAWYFTASGSISLAFSNIPASGNLFVAYLFITNGNGSGAIGAFPNGTFWPGGTIPTLTAVANKTDVFVLATADGGGKWFASVVGQNM